MALRYRLLPAEVLDSLLIRYLSRMTETPPLVDGRFRWRWGGSVCEDMEWQDLCAG
jgi:hypothetical protein